MASLIFYTDIIINRKNWRIAINKTFEHRSIFLTKRTYAHTRTPPSPYSFLFVFQWPPSPLSQRTYFLNDPLLTLTKHFEVMMGATLRKKVWTYNAKTERWLMFSGKARAIGNMHVFVLCQIDVVNNQLNL